ncbi:DinB family protein [Nocardiopsis sp. NRRL B-16309]|uniref:DinB family protein n=1 Tax=Nocardiopsis sp. NRRL B-16309 TaxID=1519494 RepID=UPI0006AE6123|nr:DinB family protein [Nocardiopsis sp. NRRL B-16309]KOX07247.1 mini-circle protein [Nocardiopsis sp. NRRL B-16309]
MSDMNSPVTLSASTRVDPPMAADERTMLLSWLDWHRSTVRVKCAGLAPELSSATPLPASPLMSIGAIVSHLRWVEGFWFEVVLLNQPHPAPYSAAEPDGEFRAGLHRPLTELLDEYDAQCARSREITARLELGSSARAITDQRGRTTLRWVLVHMIEETARHNGHLDVLRELADGTTGE